MKRETVNKFVPLEQAVTPRDGEVLANRFWIYSPVEGILFVEFPSGYWSPQCNSRKEIAEHIRQELNPDLAIRFIEAVFLGRMGICE